MAIKMVNREWCKCTGEYRYSFVMDSAADADNLPVCCVGSTAVVADNSDTMYTVNASGAWTLTDPDEGGGTGGGSSENGYVDHVSVFEVTGANDEILISNGGKTIVHMLTNDGEDDLSFNVKGVSDSTVQKITVKPGETINDFRIDCIGVSVSGTNYSFRAMVTYPEV